MYPAYSSPRHKEARVLHLLLRPAEFEEVIRCLQPILHLGSGILLQESVVVVDIPHPQSAFPTKLSDLLVEIGLSLH